MVTQSDTQAFHRLTPWNPLDQFRLLWWLFVNPARFIAYRSQVGEEATRKTAVWLFSTLFWSLPFMLTLGVSLHRTFIDEKTRSDILVWSVTGMIVLSWLVMGVACKKQMGWPKSLESIGIILVLIAFHVTPDILKGVNATSVTIVLLGIGIASGVASIIIQDGWYDLIAFLVVFDLGGDNWSCYDVGCV